MKLGKWEWESKGERPIGTYQEYYDAIYGKNVGEEGVSQVQSQKGNLAFSNTPFGQVTAVVLEGYLWICDPELTGFVYY